MKHVEPSTRVLILYYSFTNQTHRVAEAMAEQFQHLGCTVELCNIELIDEHYHIERPFRPVIPRLLGWLLPQLLGRRGKIRVPDEIVHGDYDLVCIGSPTWWLNPAMPVSSFLKSASADELLQGKPIAVFTVCRKLWWNNMRKVKQLARRRGARFIDGATFCFAGNQIQSALSFISYLKHDRDLERSCGIRIYRFGVTEEGIQRAKEFASKINSTIARKDSASHD